MESITAVENLSGIFLNTVNILAIPSKTSNSEKNRLMALTARTSSVAVGSIYEYQFQMAGTKKCQSPNPIEITLPAVTRVLIKDFFKVQIFCFIEYCSSFRGPRAGPLPSS